MRSGRHAPVAAELDSATMSLCRHVRTKDELYGLMVDAAIGSPPPAQSSGDWRAELTALAHTQREAARRHPWLPRLAATCPTLRPHAMAATEFALATMDRLGLPTPTTVGTINTVLSFVHGFTPAPTPSSPGSSTESSTDQPPPSRPLRQTRHRRDLVAAHIADRATRVDRKVPQQRPQR
ncbi:TetR/AcrR family transcriptional regulator C-terminal domain-containing protein [Amycolatopsis sp. NPDC051045]|uniref:TetR/AcrR family transcriptional regulator C-terminal domain-containing protein n=1 Tax=Amycolatopsis sp. NPDC051045 TaxID=3156922 RepID=UPI00342C17D3